MSTLHFSVYRLHFTSPLHIGDVRDDYGISLKYITSDAIYAAMTATLAKMGETIPTDGDLGCSISSLFPFYTDGDRTLYFFPRPLSVSFAGIPQEQLKKAKNANWLSLDDFEKVLQNNEALVPNQNNEMSPATFIESRVSERVTVSRSGEDAKPFYMDRVSFRGNSGLYFLVEGDTTLVETVLPLLALEGIGTDRNIGNGTFTFTKDTIALKVPDDAAYCVSLSTFIPDSQRVSSLLDDKAAYALIRRSGWITTPPYKQIRKNAIYAFSSGSVFKAIASGAGRIVNLAPEGLVEHPIWRCGKAILIPIRL